MLSLLSCLRNTKRIEHRCGKKGTIGPILYIGQVLQPTITCVVFSTFTTAAFFLGRGALRNRPNRPKSVMLVVSGARGGSRCRE
jgi:hypothetical protein